MLNRFNLRGSIEIRNACRLAILGLLLAAHVAEAADTYWQPRVQLGAGYDDNVRLAYDEPGQDIEESSSYQGQIDGELGIDSGAARSTVFARYWYQSVASNHDYDADIKQLRWNYAGGSERSLITLDVDAQFDTTLTSEFESSGLSLNKRKDRHYFRNKVGYRWNLSPRSYISSDLGADSVRYIDAEMAGLNDYDIDSLTLGFGHSISERTNLGVQVLYSSFEVPYRRLDENLSTKSETENLIAIVTASYSPTERDRLSVQIGHRQSNFYDEVNFMESVTLSKSKAEGIGQIYNVSYTREFDRSSLQLSASRDLRPNGSGAVVEQDSAGISAQTKLSELLSLTMGISLNRQRQPVREDDNAQSTYERNFDQINAGLRYSINEQHVLAFELGARRQELDRQWVDAIEAESKAAYLRWYWTPPKKSL